MPTPTAPAKRSALGKGLESLLPSRPQPATIPAITAVAEPTGKPLEIALDLIDRNPFQTRTIFDEEKLIELSISIKASGVVQPIVVRPGMEDGRSNGRYTLITGERRVLASRKAGKTTIPAVVREVSNLQAMEMTIVENLQRADLNPIEQAHAYQRLGLEFHMTQEQMAERTGQSRATIANFIRLLKLPEPVQKYIAAGDLTFGHAKALSALEPEQAIVATQRILALHLSVRATETYIQNLIHPENAPKAEKVPVVQDPNVREAEDKLRRSLGLKVHIDDKNGRGKVVIEYSGVEDFDAILTALGQE